MRVPTKKTVNSRPTRLDQAFCGSEKDSTKMGDRKNKKAINT